jgi:hypothetical protein
MHFSVNFHIEVGQIMSPIYNVKACYHIEACIIKKYEDVIYQSIVLFPYYGIW